MSRRPIHTILKRRYVYELSMRTLQSENIEYQKLENGLLLIGNYHFCPETGSFSHIKNEKVPSRGIFHLIRRLKNERSV